MTGIVFEPLAGLTAFDELRGQLGLRGLLLDSSAGPDVVLGQLELRGALTSTTYHTNSLQGTIGLGGLIIEPPGDYVLGLIPGLVFRGVESEPTPEYSLLVGALSGLGFTAVSTVRWMDTLTGSLAGVGGLVIEPEGDYVLGSLPAVRSVLREQQPPLVNYAIAVQSAGYVWSYGAYEVVQAVDVLRFSESLANSVGVIVADQLRMGEVGRSLLAGRLVASDGMRLAEVLGFGFSLIVTDGFTLGESLAFSAGAVEDLVDYLMFNDVVDTRAAALAIITSALAFADLAVTGDAVVVEDELALGDALAERLNAAAVALDALLLSEEVAHSAGFSVLIADGLALGDSVATSAALIEALTDGFRVIGRLRLGDEEYVGYVCNTANRAFSTYANFPFNSMAKIGRRYFGVADDGLYALGGPDDDGAQIRARARIAVTNLGTGKQKRMPSAYIGYQGGRLVLKAITTSATGDKEENWYAIEPRPAIATRESRIPIGKGLRSVYWGFEIEAVEPFELDSLQLFPMILERRL